MSHRAGRAIVTAVLVVGGWSSGLRADVLELVETHPYPGITHIKRTDTMPFFQCPGCGAPPTTRLARMNIVLIDLKAAGIRFKMTPPTANLPVPVCPAPPWPCPSPLFETVRQTTLGFLEASHAQVAIDSHFFAPFPVANSAAARAQSAYAYVIGLAASRGNVYSGFEAPVQNYAIVTNSPGINIDRENNASIVHRDPLGGDKQVLEDVTLWNALSGSGQTVTNGVTTIPDYKDATHPDELLTPFPPYSRGGRHWYYLSNARTAIGLTEDNKTLVLFTVDGTNGGHGMLVPEVANLLRTQYGVWNALNLDGGGSTTMAMQSPSGPLYLRQLVNTPSDNPPRPEGSNFAVYSDGVWPVTEAEGLPAANAYGWNKTDVTVELEATDFRTGNTGNLPGWVDQIQYSLAGAQTADLLVVPGSSASVEASVDVTAEGATTLTYFATDAAGNDEGEQELTVRIDRTKPDLDGLPSADCSLWPPNHEMRQVAVVTASDALSGVAPGGLQVTAAGSNPSNPDDVLVAPDGAGGFVVYLRAERRGNGQGRVYTINATATDRAGNERTVSTTCVVPHDQGTR